MNRDSLFRNRTRARRVVLAGIAAVAPTAVLAWSGCSSSSSSSGAAGPIVVDPGGTYGAEITVTVVGRGRVSTEVAGLDCPGDCFTSLVFDSATADGASGGVKLKASTTSPNTRFAGWKFDPAPIGGRGKGPESCNPIQRGGATPTVDMNADEITLPFGQTDGTAPAGQDCTGFTSVPLAYNVTATFIDTTITDAGADGDGGPGEVLYQAANGGGAAQDIGVVNGRLYWKFQSGAFFGLATGPTATTPGATPQTLVPPAQSIARIEVDKHVVVQKQSGELSVYASGSTLPTVLSGAPLTCSALTSDSSYVYCQSGDTLYQWTVGGTGPTTLYTGLPTGADRFVSDNGSYLYFVDNSGGVGASVIGRVSRSGDGGAATLTPMITGQTNPIRLRANTSSMFWINYQSAQIRGEGHTAFLGSTTSTIDVVDTSGLRFLSIDPSSSSTAWFAAVPVDDAVHSMIVKASTSGNGTTFLSGINGLGGIAVDSSYVYWTASDGAVRRASKF